MIYFAHRGANTLAPANSVAAFQLAREQGAVCYELDVHLTQDGQLLVHHDYTLGTDTTSPSDIAQLSWPEIQGCRYAGRFVRQTVQHPPLLQDVLSVLIDTAQLINIEIKNDNDVYPNIEKVLVQELQQKIPDNLDKILISSFDYATLQRLRALAPDVKIGWLTRAFDVQAARDLQAYSVHMRDTRITLPIVQACHAENQKVFIYTVNDVAVAKHLEQMGVDGIFTDDVRLFLK